jgi:hypothetical protein
MVLYGFVRNLTNKNGGMDNDGIMGIYIYIYIMGIVYGILVEYDYEWKIHGIG